MELNDVIKELEELKTRVSELENRITKEEVLDISEWANWIATDDLGEIWAYAEEPIKTMYWWRGLSGQCESITQEQALSICGRIPQCSDDEPTRVKR